MMLKRVIGFMFLVASAHSAAALTSIAATDPLNADVAEDTGVGSPAAPAIWVQPTAQAQVQVVTAPAAPAPVPERALSANPLWGIPLTSLSGTRDRPIFSSSRRPPPPAVAPAAVPNVAAVPKPKDPERPLLSLVGTIAGGDEGFVIRAGGCGRCKAAKRRWKKINRPSPSRCPSPALGQRWSVRSAMKSLRRQRPLASCCR